MKLTKIAAILLSLAVSAGTVGCSSKAAGTVSETVPVATEGGAAVSEKEPDVTESSVNGSTAGTYAVTPTDSARDREGGKIVIWSYNSDFRKVLEKYSPVKDYEFVEINAADYKSSLEAAFASGEVPDMFICSYEYVKEYADSDKTASVSSLGISGKAFSDMYDYTLRIGSDSSGNIKGMAWELAPSAVYYQRSLAAQYLGSSEQDQVSRHFESWNSFLSAARLVNRESDGNVRMTAGTDEIFKSYIGGRTAPWVTDGKLSVDEYAGGYFNYAAILHNEKLTFGASYGSDEWKAGMRNKTVLSYWGPLSLSRTPEFALDPQHGTKANPTSGDWGMVSAPGACAWNGSWIMVSSGSDMKKSCADIINAVCLDQSNLRDMMTSGMSDFVNSRSVIKEAARDERYIFAWLGGQNPYEVLSFEAERINMSQACANDDKINDMFYRIAGVYAEGKIKTVKDAKATFRELLTEKKIIGE